MIKSVMAALAISVAGATAAMAVPMSFSGTGTFNEGTGTLAGYVGTSVSFSGVFDTDLTEGVDLGGGFSEYNFNQDMTVTFSPTTGPSFTFTAPALRVGYNNDLPLPVSPAVPLAEVGNSYDVLAFSVLFDDEYPGNEGLVLSDPSGNLELTIFALFDDSTFSSPTDVSSPAVPLLVGLRLWENEGEDFDPVFGQAYFNPDVLSPAGGASATISPVPLPAGLPLLAMGVLALGVLRRRSRASA